MKNAIQPRRLVPAMTRGDVEKHIRAAFRGVQLGDGIGLHEGAGLDGYADSKALSTYREMDERKNWEALDSEILSDYSIALCYFDAEGMRFHLPAYLIDSVGDHNLCYSIMFTLLNAKSGDRRLELLNSEQRQAVREFLLFKLESLTSPNLEFEGPLLEQALTGYWMQ
ncbi:MAG: hypothetical protein JWM11_989 [Planctomycetaceae bacterium]|nr:hypothetical protein [Planctomycetaceae bacterium]